MNGSKVFVTGISGFVGQNLKPYLISDFDVQGISRKENDGDLLYNQFLSEQLAYNAIIHLAAIAHDIKNTANDSDYFEVNFELTKRLYNQFLQSEAKTFIYFSSVKAAADQVEGELTEDVVPNPITTYGKSKLMSENYILAHLPKDKKVFILRPCMIHGAGNKGNLNLLCKIINLGFPWPLGAFENQRSFLSIENLCFVIKELLENKTIPSGIYNVADDVPLSTNVLIELIANSQKRKARILKISPRMLRSIAQIGDVLHLPLHSERLQKLTQNYVVSNAKIVKALGKTLPIGSEEGLRRTFESF